MGAATGATLLQELLIDELTEEPSGLIALTIGKSDAVSLGTEANAITLRQPAVTDWEEFLGGVLGRRRPANPT